MGDQTFSLTNPQNGYYDPEIEEYARRCVLDPTMQPQTVSLTDTLKELGLYAAFKNKRDAIFNEGETTTRKDSYQYAFCQSMKIVTKLAKHGLAHAHQTLVTPETKRKKKQDKLRKAAEGRKATDDEIHEWVFSNMPADNASPVDWESIAPETVPAPGAVSLLQWAADHPDDFYKGVHLPRARKAETKKTDDDGFEDDDRRQLERLERMVSG